ncbi:sodium:solute symporter [Megamonas hypermegale]|uniref:sodium:solute symporter family protein n=1 Tax=Megamonas hypermegale TaxID=158847 RepID=UPI000B38632A|nr:sodium:solute symporter family protein [Megamonas hypermegale]OUO40443.1 sodium:solute symporter [Megamonas hypermegale]HJG07137.1 sodium:solute symporter family protein [Megamonas hypermegale]
MNWYLLVIALYAVLLIAVGVIISRRVKGADDFFVGGRKMAPFLLFITLVAPNIGAGSTVGVAGMGFTSGISAAWWIIASAVGTFILAFVIGPKIWEIAKNNGFYTLGDYLEYRYNRYFRGLISLMMAIGTLAIFAGQLMGIGWILSVVADIDKITSVLIAAVVVVLYFCAGGFLSAVYANLIEACVKLIGFIVAVPLVLAFVGGFEGLHTKVVANMANATQSAAYFSFDGLGTTVIMGFFLMLMPSFFLSPALIGKVYSARDKKTVRISTFFCGVVMLLFSIIPVILGMAAYAIAPDLPQRDLALPYVMKECMPFWASALALAAIFSAEISAADAVLYMITTSFTKDLYKSFINPTISDEKLIKGGRIVTVLAGIIGIGLAIVLPNVISALSIFYSLMSVSITAPLLFGLFTKKSSAFSAIFAAIIGVIVTVGLEFFNGNKGIWILNGQSTAILLTLIIMAVMMFIKPRKIKA